MIQFTFNAADEIAGRFKKHLHWFTVEQM